MKKGCVYMGHHSPTKGSAPSPHCRWVLVILVLPVLVLVVLARAYYNICCNTDLIYAWRDTFESSLAHLICIQSKDGSKTPSDQEQPASLSLGSRMSSTCSAFCRVLREHLANQCKSYSLTSLFKIIPLLKLFCKSIFSIVVCGC